MLPASDSILQAVERTEMHEDRLTEVTACVAHVNAAFAAALVEMAGLPADPGERYVIGTQRGTLGGRRVDMEIATYQDLQRTRLVWIEAKDGATYQPNQLEDYAADVRDAAPGDPDAGRVLTIVPPGMSPRVDSTGHAPWETKSWADVALAAERLGNTWARKEGHRNWRNWRRSAMKPESPTQWRYLAELVKCLEEKGYARMQPLTPEDVITAQRLVDLPKTITELVSAAKQRIDGVKPVKHRGVKGGDYQTFAPIGKKWFGDSKRFGIAYPELFYWHQEDWTPNRLGAPAFCAGIKFERPPRSARSELTDESWQKTLPDGATAGGSGRVVRVVRTKYLSALVVAGATFEEQAEELGRWANAAINDLLEDVTAPKRRQAAPPKDD